MQKLTLSQFGGGLQESTGPRDFAQGEWSKIKGFVFESPTRLESQWPVQRIGAQTGFKAVHPIVSTVGTFLVGISTAGSIYWCAAPSPTALNATTESTSWTLLTTTQNRGYDDAVASSQPAAEAIASNANYRFICDVSVPIADYWTTPSVSEPHKRSADTGARQGVFAGVLINTLSRTTYQQALICFVDTSDSTVKVIKYPAWRRFYQSDSYQDTVTDQGENWVTPVAKSADLFWLRVTDVEVTSNVCCLTLKRITSTRNLTINGNYRAAGTLIVKAGDWITVSGVAAGVDGTREVVSANLGTKVITFNVPADDITSVASGGIIRMIGRPFQTDQSADLEVETDYRMQPYYYITPDGATSPGRGVIPRSNTGVMWKEILLLGDVEWRLSSAVPSYTPSDSTLNFPLINSQTGPYPNYMYISSGELDTFYPYGVLETAPNGARILGMHIVRDTLVIITTAAGPESGVIGIRGNLGEVLTSTFNPAQTTFRKELIKGGIGGADSSSATRRQASALWPEAGVVAFVEASGGVWYTNGQSCQRLDMTGPKAPATAGVYDHVAATGRHLFVWRNSRLFVFSLLNSSGGMSGAWTELVPPTTEINSMVGTASELYFVGNDGMVHRFATAGPRDKRGIAAYYWNGSSYTANVPLSLSVGTPTVDVGDEQVRKNWHRFGVSFQTEETATIESVVVRASGVLNYKGSTPSYTAISTPVAYSSAADELHEVVVPAGIGMQNVASAEVTFTGHVVLESAAFWTTGASNKRGDK